MSYTMNSTEKGEFNNLEYNKLFDQNKKIFEALKNEKTLDIDELNENNINLDMLNKLNSKPKFDIEKRFNIKEESDNLFNPKHSNKNNNLGDKGKCKIM